LRNDKNSFIKGCTPCYLEVTYNFKALTFKGIIVNKTELIDAIATAADLPKASAGRALDAVLDSITNELKNGEQVALVGFGTFIVKHRNARSGRNPQTGATIQIAASKVASFKAGKALKDAVNDK
jgi:DNA-binding protein HU-beta